MIDRQQSGTKESQIRPDLLAGVLSGICEAALKPEAWPGVLQDITGYLEADGAAYILMNKLTARVEWISVSGPSVGRQADYVSHFAAIDPYTPLLETEPARGWLRLLACLPETQLRQDEWYNDFVKKSGVRDIIAAQLCSTPLHSVVFGLHYGLHRALPESRHAARLQLLNEPLRQAANLHLHLNNHEQRASVAGLALDQLGAAVIVTDTDGRIVELNRAGERLLSAGDGLTVRDGELSAVRNFETSKLAALIAEATSLGSAPTIGRMLIGRRDGSLPCMVTVAPLGAELSLAPRPLALVLISGPDQRQPSAADLADLFGLSPAESRLAAALIRGSRLSQIAVDTGPRIATLRSQLRSILKKVGVSGQADLIRTLTSIPVLPQASAKGR